MMMRTVLLLFLFHLFLFYLAPAAFSQDSVWLARTTGKGVHLDYGIGEDRLGGAKLGYLDSNILVRIVDSFHTNYKIRLSKYHSAYIAKTSVLLLGKIADQPLVHNPYLSANMRVFGDTAYDYVTVNLNERLPYRSIQLIGPSRIAVDLYGVTANTNWITQFHTAKEIKNTWYEQIEDDVLRVYIELRHEQHWGHSLSYDTAAQRLIVRVRRPPLSTDIRRLRIAIDPGHGGTNVGASGGTSNILEKEYTLLIAKELEKTLKKMGVRNVFMTRTKDTTLGMPERVEELSAFNPTLLVSIHLNSANSDTVEGTSTYYRYIGFRPLSMAILNRMLTLGLKEYGNVGNFNFSLSGPTDYPNALVEVAFLSNPKDEKRILNPAFHRLVAQKIYLGIVDWLKQLKP